MIQTQYNVVSNQSVMMVLRKLGGSQVNSNTAYQIKKLIDAVQAAMKKMSDDYREQIGKIYGVLDEKGELIPAPTPHGFTPKEGLDEAVLSAAVAEFGKKEITIDRWPLTLQQLVDVKLSAMDLDALGPFLADPEAQAPAEVTQLRR